jgi:hypothetical protein
MSNTTLEDLRQKLKEKIIESVKSKTGWSLHNYAYVGGALSVNHNCGVRISLDMIDVDWMHKLIASDNRGALLRSLLNFTETHPAYDMPWLQIATEDIVQLILHLMSEVDESSRTAEQKHLTRILNSFEGENV